MPAWGGGGGWGEVVVLADGVAPPLGQLGAGASPEIAVEADHRVGVHEQDEFIA